MIVESDPLISFFTSLMYFITYIVYLIGSFFSKILYIVNIILALVSAVECLLIVGALAEMKLKKETCECLDLRRLLDIWKTILMAISLFALREGYSVLESAGVLRIIYGYELLGLVFLIALNAGLYDFYKLLNEAIAESEKKARTMT